MDANTELASQNRRDVSVGVAVFTLLVATVAVSLRIYTRQFVINTLGLDDICAIIALVRLLIFLLLIHMSDANSSLYSRAISL